MPPRQMAAPRAATEGTADPAEGDGAKDSLRTARSALDQAKSTRDSQHRSSIMGDYVRKMRAEVNSRTKFLYRSSKDGAPQDLYRVGRVTVQDLSLCMDGHHMRLRAPFVIKAFVGSRVHLEYKLCASLLSELLSGTYMHARERAASILTGAERGARAVREQERFVIERVTGGKATPKKKSPRSKTSIARSLFNGCVGGPVDSIIEPNSEEDTLQHPSDRPADSCTAACTTSAPQ